jgi:hypothetical protein
MRGISISRNIGHSFLQEYDQFDAGSKSIVRGSRLAGRELNKGAMILVSEPGVETFSMPIPRRKSIVRPPR